MMLKYSTPIPNRFFDKLMIDLSASAIRVYLKIARNTLGWRNKDGSFKGRDWISHSQFGNIGVSSRSVTTAIDELLSQGLIRLTDEQGNSLHLPQKRKRAKRIFYSLVMENTANPTFNKAESDKIQEHFLPTTKGNYLQKYKANERIPDNIRLQQIFQEESRKQIKRDSWL